MSVYIKDNPEYFERALRSIWDDQERKPDQIVLVEDGPLTDVQYDIVDRFHRKVGDVMTIVASDENRGLPAALNNGIEYCNGDYVARMDSDDIALPARLRLEEDYLEQHPEISVVGGSIEEFNSHGDIRGVRTYPEDDHEIRNYICKANPIAHPTVMIRRDAVFGRGLRYKENRLWTQDYCLWVDCVSEGIRISNIHDVVLRFRRDDQTLKRRGNLKARNEELRVYSNAIARLHGRISWRYIFPVARYLFRLMPDGFVRKLYHADIRQIIMYGKRSQGKSSPNK